MRASLRPIVNLLRNGIVGASPRTIDRLAPPLASRRAARTRLHHREKWLTTGKSRCLATFAGGLPASARNARHFKDLARVCAPSAGKGRAGMSVGKQRAAAGKGWQGPAAGYADPRRRRREQNA